MAETALVLYGAYLALAFGLRTAIQLRRTGSSGFHGLGGRVGSAEWLAGVGFAIALILGAAAPVLALADLVQPIGALSGPAGHAAGLALAVLGIAATLYAQIAMGTSWRIGVDHGERTELVTTGPFAIVRNPIFAAMLPTALGLALLVPSWPALAGLAGLALALELQVRVVEEPYLLRVHGESYRAYAARVGRFVPGVGRLRHAALAVLAALLTGACGGGGGDGAATGGSGEADPAPMACTRASCMGGALVRLRGVTRDAASAEVCVDGRCAAIRRPIPDEVRVGLPPQDRSGGDSVRTAEATAETRDSAGALLASGSSAIRLTAIRPNGPRCRPTCWAGETAVVLRTP